jgi:hypothetical protein
MQKPYPWQILVVMILVLVPLACSFPLSGQTSAQKTETQRALIGETVQAQLTQISLSQTPSAPVQGGIATVTLSSTLAAASSATPAPASTQTDQPAPCNWAQFVADITYEDDTQVAPAASFVKTWRLKNIGTCTWSSGYQLIFDHGDRMAAPDAVSLTGVTVPPGATVDVSVTLTAPASAGSYQGFFRLRAPDGSIFGIGNQAAGAFWVKVVVPPPTPTPTATTPPKADLIITEFTLMPGTPVEGNPVHVRVAVYNQGNAAAGAFTVKWWPGENYPAPACTWNVPSSNARGGRVLECDYPGYPSYYGSIVTKVVADSENTVSESDEGNNERKMTISVSP